MKLHCLSKYSIREINYLRLLKDPTETPNKVLVHGVIADIVISIRSTGEFDDKCVCNIILFPYK